MPKHIHGHETSVKKEAHKATQYEEANDKRASYSCYFFIINSHYKNTFHLQKDDGCWHLWQQLSVSLSSIQAHLHVLCDENNFSLSCMMRAHARASFSEWWQSKCAFAASQKANLESTLAAMTSYEQYLPASLWYICFVHVLYPQQRTHE